MKHKKEPMKKLIRRENCNKLTWKSLQKGSINLVNSIPPFLTSTWTHKRACGGFHVRFWESRSHEKDSLATKNNWFSQVRQNYGQRESLQTSCAFLRRHKFQKPDEKSMWGKQEKTNCVARYEMARIRDFQHAKKIVPKKKKDGALPTDITF